MPPVKQFESFLKEEMILFRRYRIAGKRWNFAYEANLCYFSRYLNENYPEAETLTQEMVDGWCKNRDTENQDSCQKRIAVVMQFLQFLNERGLTTLKPYKFPKAEKRAYKAYSFSDEILGRFFQVCDGLAKRARKNKADKIRALMIPYFFRMLFSTGMRTTEVRLLRRDHVDFETGVINIEQTKNNIEHFTVMHDSMLEALREYDLAMDQLMPNRKYLFPAPEDSCLPRSWVSYHFKKIWKTIFSEEEAPKARAYDLRHEFISRNIDEILDMGLEADDELTYLQKAVGHTTIESTRRYYSIRPVLAGIIEEKSNSDMETMMGKGAYGNEEDHSQESDAAEMRALDAKYKKSLQSAENLLEESEAELEDDEDLLGKGAY